MIKTHSSAHVVSTTVNGHVRLAVSHTDKRIEGCTSSFATHLEAPPDVWAEVLPLVIARLPAEVRRQVVAEGTLLAIAPADAERRAWEGQGEPVACVDPWDANRGAG